MFKKIILSLILMTSSASAQEISPALKTENLKAHNHYRALHNADALIWDDKLANYASQHASSCMFKHSGGPYGENLAAGYQKPSLAIQAWYNEKKNYDYSHPGFSNATGHFSQLVWKGSHRIGCAFILCNGKNKTPGNFLICEYDPAGNITNASYFSNNVG